MNGTEETKDLWAEIHHIHSDITEIKTILKALPEKINYYSMVNLQHHQENCLANQKVFTHEKKITELENRLINIEKDDTQKSDNWNSIKKHIISTIVGALITGLIFLSVLGLKTHFTEDSKKTTQTKIK